MKSAFGLLVSLILAGTATSGQAGWQRVARMEHDHVEASAPFAHGKSPGCRVVSSKGIGKADALASHDPVDAATLGAGDSEAVLSLGHQEVIHGVSFANDGIEGRLIAQGSQDQKSWVNLVSVTFTPADRFVDGEWAGTMAKYVKISFALTRGGSIRDFEVHGQDSDQDYDLIPAAEGTKGMKINLADGIGGTRVIYVHPTPANSAKIGTHDKGHQPFQFPESNEKYRTIIYDLGQTRRVSEFGSVHSPRPVRFQVYAFTQLPETQDWRGRLTFDPKAFEETKPIAEVEDKRGVGYIKVRTKSPVSARYVALRWEPDFNPPAFTVGGVNVSTEDYGAVAPTGAGAPEGNNVSEGGGPVEGGPPPGYYPPGVSPWGYGTAGYAGGGGSLPADTDEGDGITTPGGTTVITGGGTTQLPPPAAGGSGSPNTQ